MRLKNDGAESKRVFVAKGSRAAIIKVDRQSKLPTTYCCQCCNNAQGRMGLEGYRVRD